MIFFSIHQSNWELLVPVIDQLGISVGAIYRHINNKFIDKLIIKKRNQSINTKRSFYTPKGKESAKEIISAIKNNSSMILLIDQKDNVRIPKAYRSLVNILEGEIVFENEDLLIKILNNVIENYF